MRKPAENPGCDVVEYGYLRIRGDSHRSFSRATARRNRPPATEVTIMGLVSHLLHRELQQETKCPRCGTPAPLDDVECNVCGWDLGETYHDPTSGVDRQPEIVTRSQLGRHPRAL
jgi:hypothetical protein